MNLQLYQYNKKETEKALDEATKADGRLILFLHVGINNGHKIGVSINPDVDMDDMIKALEIVTGALRQSQEQKKRSGIILPRKA